MELNTLYQSDCIALIKSMPDNFIDKIITSPPYNIGKIYSNFKDKMSREDYINWMVSILNAVEPKLKRNGLVFINLNYAKNDALLPYSLIEAISSEKTAFTIVDTIIWKKPNSQVHNDNRLKRVCEFVFVISRKTEVDRFTLNNRGFGNYIEAHNNDRMCKRWNSQPYSTELVLKILKYYGKKTDVVYDCFSGIGTTIRACLIYGCSWIGSELDWRQANFFNNKRLEAVLHKLPQLRIDYKDIL